MLIHCGKLTFSLLFSCYYSNIEILTTYNIPFYFKKDQIIYLCFRIVQDLLFGANKYHPSPRETDIKHISDNINKVMEQNRLTKEP